MTDRTVFSFGLDGLPRDFLAEAIDRGDAPNLERLGQEGVEGTTRSTVPPLSMVAWSTYATGQNPGNHGIYNFMIRDGGRYDTSFVDASDLRERAVTLWDYLDSVDIPSAVMNVMPGYPVSRTAGVHISDNVTTPPGAQFTHPESFREEIESLVGEYYISPYEEYEEGGGERDLQKYLDRLFEIERDRVTIAKHIIEKYDIPFHSYVFSGPDNVLHSLAHLLDESHPKHNAELAAEYGDVPFDLLGVYDEFLGWTLKQMDEEDVLLVLSDHGHGSVYSKINLNAWLYNNGYLSVERNLWTRLKLFGYDHLYDSVERVLSELDIFGYVKNGVARTSGGDGIDLADLVTISQSDIDWQETVAYTVASGGQVYLNTVDDHTEGCVTSDEYDRVRERLKQDLSNIEHPEYDEPVIAEVYDGEELYTDGHEATRPDIVAMPAPGHQIQFPQAMQTNSVFGEPPETGTHASPAEMDGVFRAYGGPVGCTNGVTVKLSDFAPTVLHLLGLPVPPRMDGEVVDPVVSGSPEYREYAGRVVARRATRAVADSIE